VFAPNFGGCEQGQYPVTKRNCLPVLPSSSRRDHLPRIVSEPWNAMRDAHGPSAAVNVPPGWNSFVFVSALWDTASLINLFSVCQKIWLICSVIRAFHWRFVSWIVRMFAPMSTATCTRARQWMKSLSVFIILTFLARMRRMLGPGLLMSESPHGSFLVGGIIGVWCIQ